MDPRYPGIFAGGFISEHLLWHLAHALEIARLAHVEDLERSLDGPAAHRAHRKPDAAPSADAVMTARHDCALHAAIEAYDALRVCCAHVTRRAFEARSACSAVRRHVVLRTRGTAAARAESADLYDRAEREAYVGEVGLRQQRERVDVYLLPFEHRGVRLDANCAQSAQ